MDNTETSECDLTASPVLIHALEWFTGSPLDPEALDFARFAAREVYAHGYRPFSALYAEFKKEADLSVLDAHLANIRRFRALCEKPA